MLTVDNAGVLALATLLGVAQCIAAALYVAFRAERASRNWTTGLMVSCAAALLTIVKMEANWAAAAAACMVALAQILLCRGVAYHGELARQVKGARRPFVVAALGTVALLGVYVLLRPNDGSSHTISLAGYVLAIAIAAFTLASLVAFPAGDYKRSRPLVLVACALQVFALGCALHASALGVPDRADAMGSTLLLLPLPTLIAVLASLSGFSLMTMERCLAEQERQARLDPLTALANRGAIDSAAITLCEEYARHAHPLSCLVIDVDHFKRVNDGCGHRTGDLLLQRIAGVVQDIGRASDLTGRYGGEEFCVLCPHTTELEAQVLAKRLLEAIRAVPLPPEIGGFASVSIGVAEVTEKLENGATTWDLVFGRADKALYEAKARGRDCSVRASELVDTVALSPAPAPEPQAPPRIGRGPSVLRADTVHPL
jgi:diguanylate cyclase (GGDEF)-like protein